MIYIVFCMYDNMLPQQLKVFTDKQLSWDYEEWLIDSYKDGPVIYLEREADEWKFPLQ